MTGCIQTRLHFAPEGPPPSPLKVMDIQVAGVVLAVGDASRKKKVRGPGLEPGTSRLKAECSTN